MRVPFSEAGCAVATAAPPAATSIDRPVINSRRLRPPRSNCSTSEAMRVSMCPPLLSPSVTEQALAARFAERRQRTPSSGFGIRYQRDERGGGPQAVELPRLRERRHRTVSLGNRALQVAHPHVAGSGVTRQPSLKKDGL